MRDYRQSPSSHVFLSSPRLTFLACQWFSHALAFRSLYYPWGRENDNLVPKALFPGKTRDAHSLQFLYIVVRALAVVKIRVRRGGGGGDSGYSGGTVQRAIWNTYYIQKTKTATYAIFPWVGGREHSIVWSRRVCATAQHNVVWARVKITPREKKATRGSLPGCEHMT